MRKVLFTFALASIAIGLIVYFRSGRIPRVLREAEEVALRAAQPAGSGWSTFCS
jgi:hypothetical protein